MAIILSIFFSVGHTNSPQLSYYYLLNTVNRNRVDDQIGMQAYDTTVKLINW